jgi:NAD(P)-dependent dehydrogenase (short-subunit alcohol dehydrogenase family)
MAMPKPKNKGPRRSRRTVLITGGNKGIGFESARQLSAAGWHVIIGARRARAGREAASTLARSGAAVSFLEFDVAETVSITRAAAEFGAGFEKLDVLINNAGIYPDEGLNILTISREQLTETFQTNAFGAVAVTQAFLPYLRKASDARVINLSSGYGQLEGLSPNVPSYCLSKLTLNGITLMLAEALQSDGIAVNSMSPGWVRTDMGGSSAPRSVEEGADTAVWLATEAPQNLTGKFLQDRTEIPW